MGGFVAHQSVPIVTNVLNERFAPGDPLDEMVALQKEFGLFSLQHPLARASALLNIAPTNPADRQGWFKYLDYLKSIGSEDKAVNGHDRIITAIKQNLEAKKPMPMYFTWHPGRAEPIVTVRNGQPYIFSSTEFVIVEAPVKLAAK
jgi:hypothetical protein